MIVEWWPLSLRSSGRDCRGGGCGRIDGEDVKIEGESESVGKRDVRWIIDHATSMRHVTQCTEDECH